MQTHANIANCLLTKVEKQFNEENRKFLLNDGEVIGHPKHKHIQKLAQNGL